MPAIIFFSSETLRLARSSNRKVVNSAIKRFAIASLASSDLSTRIYFCISDNCFLRTVSSLFKVPINSDNCLD